MHIGYQMSIHSESIRKGDQWWSFQHSRNIFLQHYKTGASLGTYTTQLDMSDVPNETAVFLYVAETVSGYLSHLRHNIYHCAIWGFFADYCMFSCLDFLRQWIPWAQERLAKLIALISGLPALSCHVAAKFLRVTWCLPATHECDIWVFL